ncbi:MAG: hypothetical protein RL227_2478 [Pseudomonadota bacterium]|jgi:hypothetical protein
MQLPKVTNALTATAQPMEIIHERDPVTGLVIRSYERPLMH